MEAGNLIEAKEGSPQGGVRGVISPLLANIYLNPLDWLLSDRLIKFARYADDIVILAKSAEEAEDALEQIKQWMDYNLVGKIADPARIKSATLHLTRTAGSDGVFHAHGILPATGA